MRIVLSTFALVFIAELGDKTQLAVMLLAAQKKAPGAVLLGAASALVVSSVIGVFAGMWLMKIVPAHYLRMGAGVMFMVMGAFILWGKL